VRVERYTSFVGHDRQEDIEESFRMMQTFQEAVSDEAMFDPSETAVTPADAIWAEDRDVGSHGEEGKGWGERESIAIRVPHAAVTAFNSSGDSSLAVIMRFASLTSITWR
jgi:hypothetical protein